MTHHKFPYSEKLITPRSDIAARDPDIRTSPLLDSQRLRRIRAVYEASPKDFDDGIEAAGEIGGLVRHTLRFKNASPGDNHFTPDNLGNNPKVNCYGMTIVASELLESMGIDHAISFANEHSFLTLLDGDKVYMVDPTDKNFSHYIHDAIGGERIDQQLATQNRFASNTLYADVIIGKVSKSANKGAVEIIETHPWLSFSNRFRLSSGELRQIDQMLVMRTFHPDDGREMLEGYLRARTAFLNGELGSAVDALCKITGLYPEADTRNRQGVARQIIASLVKLQRYDEAAVVMASVADSMENDTSNNTLFPIDVIRLVGDKARSVEILTDALTAYKNENGDRANYSATKTARMIRRLKTMI